MNLKKHSALIMALAMALSVSTATLAHSATDYNRGNVPTQSTSERSTTGEYRDSGIKRDGMTDREASFERNRTENRSTNNTGGGYTYSPGATHPDDVRSEEMNKSR